MATAEGVPERNRVGDTLRRFVNLISHRSDSVSALMEQASITLPQVVLLSRIEQFGSTSLSSLMKGSHVSIPAVSQMVERLVQQRLLERTEDRFDRRRKVIAVTPLARVLLRKIESTRSAEYELGLVGVHWKLRVQIAQLLERAILEIERERAQQRRRRG